MAREQERLDMQSTRTKSHGPGAATDRGRHEQMQAIVQDTVRLGRRSRTAHHRPSRRRRDEVLIEVHAAGVDRGVWHLMTGLPYLIRLAGYGVRSPRIPCSASMWPGESIAIGDDVTRFQPGDEVFGIGKGSYAEYADRRPRTSSPRSRPTQHSNKPRLRLSRESPRWKPSPTSDTSRRARRS